MLALEGSLAVQAGANPAVSPKNKPGFPKYAGATVRLIFFALLLFGVKSPAQDAAPTEYQIKAAFVYNFAKFVEWPPEAFAAPTSPIVIGVLGENVFGDNLQKAISNKVLNDRPLQFKEFHSVAEATNCHILFISTSEKAKFSKIMQGLRGTSVLTVGETGEFIGAGGMINFVLEANKVRFQINDEAAKKAGLKISSKLLSLAIHP
ncbi:MAG TPA: YfiR family protein [Candidatus Acidoferrales bacterium]|nr:YfiR family protein [Candidatus Acidoferrales bacterium]